MTNAVTVQPRQTSVEVASSASAALAKATIEAKFTIALHRPRNIMDARATILDACKRPRFAEGAWYRIPNKGEGFTIRFAEQALNAWRNVDVIASTAWEDDDKRLVRITVTDLESNISFADEVLLNKTVERRNLKPGQEPLATRITSDGNKVYVIACTEDELALKVNSAKSKVIRNSGLRLIPQDILEEAEEQVRATNLKGGTDSKAEVKKVADAFMSLNVSPAELTVYLGHSLETVSPSELADLRAAYRAIKDGQATWQDYRKQRDEAEKDDVPMDHPPQVPQPPTKPATTDPRGELQAKLSVEGLTFQAFRDACEKAKILSDPTAIGCIDDIAAADCKRLLRAWPQIAAQIGGEK